MPGNGTECRQLPLVLQCPAPGEGASRSSSKFHVFIFPWTLQLQKPLLHIHNQTNINDGTEAHPCHTSLALVALANAPFIQSVQTKSCQSLCWFRGLPLFQNVLYTAVANRKFQSNPWRQRGGDLNNFLVSVNIIYHFHYCFHYKLTLSFVFHSLLLKYLGAPM